MQQGHIMLRGRQVAAPAELLAAPAAAPAAPTTYSESGVNVADSQPATISIPSFTITIPACKSAKQLAAQSSVPPSHNTAACAQRGVPCQVLGCCRTDSGTCAVHGVAEVTQRRERRRDAWRRQRPILRRQ